MRKYLRLFMLAFVLMLAGCSNSNQSDDKIIYTSIYPITDFTKKIAGDKIKVEQLIANESSSHDWEPTPQDIAKVNNATALIYNGAGFEHWIDDIKESNNENTIFVDTSKNIKLLASSHTHDDEDDDSGHDDEDSEEHEEDEHEYDPHIWLSPLNAKIQLENIKNALIEIDEENADFYTENYKKYVIELDKLHQEYQKQLEDVKTREIVVSHAAFGYLAHEYDLTQKSLAGIENEAEATAARMAEIIKFINKNEISTIFYEEQINTKIADTIANETKASTALLTPIESLSKEQIAANDDYFSLMESNLKELVKALK